MSRDGMPRAYLRVDPNIDQHPDPLGMILLLCAAARQPERGRFRDRAVLVRAVGPKRTREFERRHDVVTLPDHRVYVEGWDEWQEGDWTVAERMRRMRARRAEKRKRGVPPVTVPPSPPRTDVTTDAVGNLVDVGSPGVGVGVVPPNPPPGGGRRSNGTNPRSLAAKEREAERARAQRNRLEGTQRRIHDIGGHADEPSPGCPKCAAVVA